MAEHGPLHLNEDDTISLNPHAWNQKANMIYLEAPVGVGYSEAAPEEMETINDDTTSSDNRDAIKGRVLHFRNTRFCITPKMSRVQTEHTLVFWF